MKSGGLRKRTQISKILRKWILKFKERGIFYRKQLLRKKTSRCDFFGRRSYWISSFSCIAWGIFKILDSLVSTVRKVLKKLCVTIRTKWLICNYYTIRFCGQIEPFLTCRIKWMLGIAVYGQQKIRTLFKLHLYIP